MYKFCIPLPDRGGIPGPVVAVCLTYLHRVIVTVASITIHNSSIWRCSPHQYNLFPFYLFSVRFKLFKTLAIFLWCLILLFVLTLFIAKYVNESETGKHICLPGCSIIISRIKHLLSLNESQLWNLITCTKLLSRYIHGMVTRNKVFVYILKVWSYVPKYFGRLIISYFSLGYITELKMIIFDDYIEWSSLRELIRAILRLSRSKI